MPVEPSDLSTVAALLVDPNEYHRAIAADILRSGGIGKVLVARTAEEGLDAARAALPGLILTEWLEGPNGGLEFIRRLRGNADMPNRAVPILMLTGRRRQRDVEAARAAGADAYLTKPVSAGAIVSKLDAVVLNPQPFVATPAYVGPCRRRRSDAAYKGPRRRLTDIEDRRTGMADEDDEVKMALRRARAAALTRHARDLQPGDAEGARAVYGAARALQAMAAEIGDKTLVFGASQLVRYMQAVGATDRLDPEAVRTHVRALDQLANLPNALADERRDVATSLRRMVDKKLKRAGAA